MTQFSSARHLLSAIALGTVAFSLTACGAAPSRTETTTSDVVERADGGGEVHRSVTETRETDSDGIQTTDRNETTQTTPAQSE